MTTAMVGGKKPRVLCLHGFRTSGAIMKDQVLGKWPECLTSNLDLVFLDAPFPAEGRSDVDGLFPPPYYEWYQFDKVNFLYLSIYPSKKNQSPLFCVIARKLCCTVISMNV